MLPKCWVLSMDMFFSPGILEIEECSAGLHEFLLLCSPLFFSVSSSVLHWKSQMNANPGISALGTCCQRAGLFWSFSAGFTRIFVGLLIQSSFRLHKKLFLRWLFGRFSGYRICSGETSFDSKNCFSYGWIPLLGQAEHSHQCLLYFCDTVMLSAASLREISVSVEVSQILSLLWSNFAHCFSDNFCPVTIYYSSWLSQCIWDLSYL